MNIIKIKSISIIPQEIEKKNQEKQNLNRYKLNAFDKMLNEEINKEKRKNEK